MKKSAIRRYAGLLLLFGIFSLNIYIFLTLPAHHHNDYYPRESDRAPPRYDSQGISHLQFPRKRLNKSNFTSESLGADVRGRGAGGGAWEEGVGDHLDKKPEVRNTEEEVSEERGIHHGQGRKERDPKNSGPATGEEGADNHPPLVPHAPVRKFDIVDQKMGSKKKLAQDAEPVNPEKNTQKPKKEKTTGTMSFSRNFTDPRVDAFVKMLEDKGMLNVLHENGVKNENYWMFLRRQRQRRKSGIQLPLYKNYKAKTNWEKFHKGIHQHYLYDPDSAVIHDLLRDLTYRKIIDVEQKEGGTQIKLIITFEDGGRALLKPMRFPRETQTLPDHFYFADYERHIAEIAAFHLDRVLGYNRVPPVAGRLVNVTREIKDLAEHKLARTFFTSPAGNQCFHGTCSYYCDSSHPICGHPDHIEASFMAFLPVEKMGYRQTWRNPWKRSYSKHRKAYWEAYDDLCEKIKHRAPYNSGRRLLDIIDMSILDFMMGNLDRHHYETFRDLGNDSFIIQLDHGRGFGKPYEDDLSCMAPLLQCCMIRLSTLQRLVKLYSGEHPLSVMMRVSLSTDQVSPVLIEPHLQALDRRLVKVLQAVMDCAEKKGRTLTDVIVDDGVY